MPVTLCLPPRPGESLEQLTFLLSQRETVCAVPARHLVRCIEADPRDRSALMVVVDAAVGTARPVDVRFELRALGDRPGVRSRSVGRAVWHGEDVEVYGTYLGPVSDEN
jgi:hypothetical protein